MIQNKSFSTKKVRPKGADFYKNILNVKNFILP